MSLPKIPFETEHTSVQGIIKKYPDRFEGMVTACFDAAEELGAAASFRVTDKLSERSMARNADMWAPYKSDYDFAHARMTDARGGNSRGVPTVLLTDEWGCSTKSVRAQNGGVQMQRLLDIPPHVGHLPIVTKKDVASGELITATYPGLIGEAHGMTSKFAIAQHVAPTPKTMMGKLIGERAIMADYMVNAFRNVSREGYSPTILIRKTLEEASDADEALDMLSSYPLTSPIVYHFSTADQGYIIERMPNDAVIHEGTDLCGTNTWLNDKYGPAWSKPHAPIPVQAGESGEERLEIIQQSMAAGAGIEASYKPLTRLRLDMNVAQGTFRAEGLEHATPATEVLEHQM